MGRSNPTTYVPNPAKHTVSWAGADGFFAVYDKEKKERVMLDLPFRFAWVENTAAITGFHEDDNPSKQFFIQSNELLKVKEGTFQVFHYEKDGEKSKKVVDHEGTYDEIKDAVKSRSYGGRYTTVIYAVSDGDNGPIKSGDIIRIEIAGAALNAWIDKGFSQYDGGVCVEESIEKKKGRVTYYQPIFKQEQISSDLNATALEADKAITAWIDQDSSGQETAQASGQSAPPAGPDVGDEYEDDVPF